MFYTGKEIAEKFSTDTIKLKESNIRNWANRGLKHIRGPHNTFMYKLDWVEKFIEEQAEKNINDLKVQNFLVQNIPKRNKKINKCDYINCKIN